MKQLGDILIEGGLVTRDQLDSAVLEQNRLGRSLGRVLVDQGVLTESQLVASLAEQIGIGLNDRKQIKEAAQPVRAKPPVRKRAKELGVKNVVVLTTDTHANLVNEVRYHTLGGTPEGSGIWEVVTGPVATNSYAKEIDAALGGKPGERVQSRVGGALVIEQSYVWA